jgi:hypothetical protein
MAKRNTAPLYVRAGNFIIITLLRMGFKLKGIGKYPMYLLTVRGRKSGQPRTVPIPCATSDWPVCPMALAYPFCCRCLFAAGEASVGCAKPVWTSAKAARTATGSYSGAI